MSQGNFTHENIGAVIQNFYSKESAANVYPDFAAMAKRAVSEDPLPNNSKIHRGFEFTKVRRKIALVAVAAVAIAGLTVGVSYFSPKFEQTALAGLSHVPGIGHIVPQNDTGMLSIIQSNKVEYQNISSTQKDLKITLLTAYTDSTRTLVFLRITPLSKITIVGGTWIEDFPGMELRDQFGHHYRTKNADTIDGDVMIQFDPVPDWVRSVGMRFNLVIPTVANRTTTNGQDLVLSGPWKLRWTQIDGGQSTVLTPNVTSTDNGISVHLSKVLMTPSAVQVQCQIDGKNTNVVIDRVQYGRRYTLNNMKPPALDQFSISKQASQQPLNTLSGGLWVSSATSTAITGGGTMMFTPITTSGTYNLVITRISGVDGHWALPFSVNLK